MGRHVELFVAASCVVCAVDTVFALGLCGGCKGGETPLRGGRRELSGESMA